MARKNQMDLSVGIAMGGCLPMFYLILAETARTLALSR
jgi:hypothetical protein